MAEEGNEDKDQKTEQPTSKRLEEARKRGQVPTSREIPSFLMLALFTLLVAWYLPDMMRRARNALVPFLANASDYTVDHGGVSAVLWYATVQSLQLVMVPLLAAVAVALVSVLGQNGFVISAEPLLPKWSKISPIAGLARMFSLRSLIELVKGLLKIGIVGVVCYMAVVNDLGHLKQMSGDEVIAMLLFLSKMAVKMLTGVCIAMFFIALFDLVYQRFDYIKNLRMSKQELKEEYKQQEGDPIVKQRLRQIRMERARKRMMAAVPGADVVITNPTHFAVALKYDTAAMQAPVLVAKGQDFMALNMRRIAEENDVPVVENPPLARALYSNVEVDQEIPVQHYKAVAEIISYVYRLKGKMPAAPGGARAAGR